MKRSAAMRRLLLIIAIAFVLRAVALLLTTGIECLNDECSYSELAGQLARGEGFQAHSRHYWPPGYVAFLALHLVTAAGLTGAKATQVLLSTLLVPLVFGLGRRAAIGWGDQAATSVGLLAATLIAFNPTLVAYSHYLWSETLFLPFFVGALLLGLDASRSGSLARAAAAGLLCGLACLIKVLPLYFVPVFAGYLALRGDHDRRRFGAGLVVVAATFLVILPWSVRNTLTYGRFVLIETTTGKALLRGNNPVAPANWDWGARRRHRGAIQRAQCTDPDPIEHNACLARRGLANIVEHPGRFLRQAATKIADLCNPTSFTVRHIRREIYGPWPLPVADAVVVFIASFNVALMGLAAVGWINGPAGRVRSLAGLLLAYMLAIHVVTHAMSRFRMPFEPFLAVGTALALARPKLIAAQLRVRGQALATAALLVALLASWSVRAGALLQRRAPSNGDSEMTRKESEFEAAFRPAALFDGLSVNYDPRSPLGRSSSVFLFDIAGGRRGRASG